MTQPKKHDLPLVNAAAEEAARFYGRFLIRPSDAAHKAPGDQKRATFDGTECNGHPRSQNVLHESRLHTVQAPGLAFTKEGTGVESMRHTKMTTKQTNTPKTPGRAFEFLVLSMFLIIFAASCTQVTPTGPIANAAPKSQPANPEADKAEVRKFLDDHGDAMVRVDTATLDRMWADDLVLIDHEGNTLTKKQWLELLTSGTEKIEPSDRSSNTTDVRIYGNTAVAILKVIQKATLEGKPHDGKMTISTVLVKGERGWQLVSAQLSELKPVSEDR